MKKLFACIMILCMTLSLAACTTDSTSEVDRVAAIDLEETYASSPATLAVVYNNLNDMLSDADIVVKGSVVEQEVVMLDGFPQTHTSINVTTVLKGSIVVGDSIEVIEEGGHEGKVMSGIPQLSKENDYYLMLIEYKGSYYVCGAFQGRFIEREGYVFQQATSDVKLTKSYSPMTSEEFEEMIADNLTVISEKEVTE